MTYGCSAVIGITNFFIFYRVGISIHAIDLAVNAICVVLMKRKMDVWYRRACWYPDICINFCIISCLSFCEIIGRRERSRIDTSSAPTRVTQDPQTGTGVQGNLSTESDADDSTMLQPFPTGMATTVTITAELHLRSIDETSIMRPVELQLEPIHKETVTMKDFSDVFGCDFDKAVELVISEQHNKK